jgi:gamma-glutamyl phosphate reductase
MADALVERADEVLAANAADVEAAAPTAPRLGPRPAAAGPRPHRRVADALRQLVALPDPVGDVVRGSTLPNGLQLRQVRVPLGVVGIVYEARPNVTVDAAACASRAATRRCCAARPRRSAPTPRWSPSSPRRREGRAARGLGRAAARRPAPRWGSC